VWENSVVPPGLESFVPCFPALARWAKLVRPSGTGFSGISSLQLGWKLSIPGCSGMATVCSTKVPGRRGCSKIHFKSAVIPNGRSCRYGYRRLVKDAALRLLEQDSRLRAGVRECIAQADREEFSGGGEMDASRRADAELPTSRAQNAREMAHPARASRRNSAKRKRWMRASRGWLGLDVSGRGPRSSRKERD
jgi:hypothetical protein